MPCQWVRAQLEQLYREASGVNYTLPTTACVEGKR